MFMSDTVFANTKAGKCGRAKRLNTLHCITNRAETRPLLRACCTHARIQTRSVGNAANACPPNSLSLPLSLSLSRTRAHTFSLLRFFLSFSPLPLRAFVRLDASAACFSKLVRDTAESHKERFFRFRVRLRGAEFP